MDLLLAHIELLLNQLLFFHVVQSLSPLVLIRVIQVIHLGCHNLRALLQIFEKQLPIVCAIGVKSPSFILNKVDHQTVKHLIRIVLFSLRNLLKLIVDHLLLVAQDMLVKNALKFMTDLFLFGNTSLLLDLQSLEHHPTSISSQLLLKVLKQG